MSNPENGQAPNDQQQGTATDPNVNAGNNNTQGSTVDWSQVDVSAIPEDVIKKSALYQGVLTESIQRRQEISRLKGEQKPADEQKPQQPDNKPNDQISQLASQLQQITQTMDNWNKQQDKLNRINAAQSVGLDVSLADRLEGSSYDEYLTDAKKLADMFGVKPANNNQSNKQQDNSSPSNPAGDKRDQGMLNSIKDRMYNGQAANPFSPGFQTKMGGGVFDKEK